MGTVRQRKRKQVALIVASSTAILAMVLYNALRPAATQDDRVQEFSDAILHTDWDHMTEADRERFRQQWSTFPPEVRKQVFAEVARQRLQTMREQTRGLPPEQRAARIQQAVLEMRQQQQRLSPAEREHIRQRLNSAEGKEMVGHVMDFYLHEFTARERAEMDPLVREWLAQVERLAAGR
jgi:hypothetical protein